jgi:hypothetical protein
LAGRKRKRKTRRRKSKNMYFHAGTQAAIVKFQQSDSEDEKSKLYQSEILPAFDKLAENLIFMHGFNKTFDSFEMLKNDCVSFLYETLYKWDPERGKKAFSYFNVVARNWLIIKSKKKTKNNRRHVSMDDQDSLSSSQKSMIENHNVVPGADEILLEKERIEDIVKLLKEIKTRITNENEMLCIDAIIKIFSHVDELEFLNKRAIFVYIRDLSSLNPKQLSVAMSQIRKHYKELSRSDDFGIFD